MDNCWISCQVMADMKKVYNDLIIISRRLTGSFWRLEPVEFAVHKDRISCWEMSACPWQKWDILSLPLNALPILPLFYVQTSFNLQRTNLILMKWFEMNGVNTELKSGLTEMSKSKFVFVLIINGTIYSSSNATYLHRGAYDMDCLVLCLAW